MKKTSQTHFLRLLALSAAAMPSARAIDYVWSVTGTSPWASSTNWTPNGAPGATDTIAIGGTAATAITMDGAKSAASLSVTNTGTTALSSASGPFGLTLGSGGLNVAAGSGIVTIGGTTAASNVPITLAASQAWTSNSTTTHLIRGSISGPGQNLTVAGNFDLRTHAGGTPAINLGTGTLTQAFGNFEIGSGANTMAGYVLKGGFVFARNTGNFGTTGTITLGDTAASTTPVALRLATGTGNWSRPIVLASGTTGLIYIDNLGTPNSPVLTGGITGTNNLTLQSTISSAAGAVTLSTAAIDFTGALILKNQGTGSSASATGTITINSPITDKVTTVTTQDVSTGTKGLQRTILNNNANAWTGATTISANSRVELGNSEVIPDGSGKGNLTVNGNLVLKTSSGDSTETVNGLSGSGSITRTGTTGTSTLVAGGNDAGGTFTGPITDGSGKLALTKIGSGTLALSGPNTYSGLTTVSGGTLQLDFPDMIADTGAIEIASTAALNLSHGETETVSNFRINGVPQATGTWGRIGSVSALGADFESAVITGDGLLEVTNLFTESFWDGTGTSWQSAAAWSISPTDAALNPSAPPGLNNATRFGLDGLTASQFITLDGDQATPGMSFTSPVSFTFEGGNGDHLLEIGTGGIGMAAGSTGVVFGSFNPGQEVDLRLAASQIWSNESTTGDLAATNTVDLQANTLTITGAGDSFIDGPVTGAGALTKSGAGSLGLFGTNDYGGLTSIQGGSIFLGTPTALGSSAAGTTVSGGGTLDLNGQALGAEAVTLGTTTAANLVNTNAVTPASLSGDVNLNFNANVGGAGEITLSGIISQTGGNRNLTKTGTGKLILTNANLHAGTTTIANNTGAVAISNGAALGTGPVSITKGGTNGGTLELSNNITVANNMTFASATGFGGGGSAQIRNVSGNNTLTGTLTLTATGGNGINIESLDGLLTIGNTVTSTIADNTRQLGITGSGNGLITGNIVNTGTNQFSVIKHGTGTWTLSGTNTYTGTTIVNEGTLSLTNNGGLADTASVSIASGATLNLAFSGSDTIATLTLGGVVQGPGIYSASHPSGLITGTGSLVVPVSDPFTPWIDSFTFSPGADKTKTGDPDGDGLSNLQEFAFHGDPSNGSASGKIRTLIDSDHLTLTLPVRNDAIFAGTGPLVATVDDVRYEIDASTDLGSFAASIEESTALGSGLPILPAGWTYRTFRLVTPVSAAAKGFLRADATDAP